MINKIINKIILIIFLIAGFGLIVVSIELLFADDLDDGISKYTDESISAEDEVGKKDNNISFIVVDAIGKSKMIKEQNEKENGKDGEDKTITNAADGKQDKNENSVVVESGSRVEKIYNIIIEK